MLKFARNAVLLLAGVSLAGVAVATPHRPQHAKITMAQAREIALRAAPGRVTSSEYEYEGGGWRYSFDIQQPGHIQEIGVDGQTGRIVENKSEGRVDHD